MSVKFYMDVHIPYTMTEELRIRGVDVLTAQQDGTRRLPDAALLDRANELGRILVTEDKDFLKEAAIRQRNNLPFNGIIFISTSSASLGECIAELELIANAATPEEMANLVTFLPLK